MSKSTSYFFSHDYNTRTDDKIKNLIRKHGMTGYGIYWAIIEDLYNNANALQLDYYGISYDLRTNEETIYSIINDFDLFVIDGNTFGSFGVQERIDKVMGKSQKARENAYKRWHKQEPDANALPQQSNGNAIYNIKEDKIISDNMILDNNTAIAHKKSLEDRLNDFKSEVYQHVSQYGSEMLDDFIRYWSEPNRANNPKMKFELNKTWSLSGRLATWHKNSTKFKPANKSKGMFEAAEELRKSLEEF